MSPGFYPLKTPAQLTREQEKILRDAASGKPELKRGIKIGADGHFEETLSLRENDELLSTDTAMIFQ